MSRLNCSSRNDMAVRWYSVPALSLMIRPSVISPSSTHPTKILDFHPSPPIFRISQNKTLTLICQSSVLVYCHWAHWSQLKRRKTQIYIPSTNTPPYLFAFFACNFPVALYHTRDPSQHGFPSSLCLPRLLVHNESREERTDEGKRTKQKEKHQVSIRWEQTPK